MVDFYKKWLAKYHQLDSKGKRQLYFFVGSFVFMIYVYFQDPPKKEVEEPPKVESRAERIEKQFSAWDGSHRGFERFIKKSMNDPDSYEHVETRFKDEGETLLVFTTFRGKNAFGGKVTNTMSARVDLKGNVVEVIK